MLPTASTLYMRPPQGNPYGPQPYFVAGPLTQQIRPVARALNNSSFMGGPMTPSNAMKRTSSETITSMMGAMPASDSPVSQTRRFNSYKETRNDTSSHFGTGIAAALNASSGSVRMQAQQQSSSTVFENVVRQAVADGIRSEKELSGSPLIIPGDSRELQDALLREREERRQLKAMLKAERKEYDLILERLKRFESSSSEQHSEGLISDLRKSEKERILMTEEMKVLQAELSELRQEKILSDQLDEEHSAKMKVYTEDLKATSVKYQGEIKQLISRNEELVQQIEVLRAKGKEQERQIDHLSTVQESLNKKVISKDTELAQLKKDLDRYTTSSASKRDEHSLRIKDLENIIKKQTETIFNFEKMQVKSHAPLPQDDSDAFSVLRNKTSGSAGPSPKAGRRVSTHLTAKKDATYAPMIISADQNDWLEPLAIAEHVLGGNSVSTTN